MKEYKYHYTYLITNLSPLTDMQFYVGVKSCTCLPEKNSNYMGSSLLLAEDIKLFGNNNFQKIILDEFESREEAEAHEREIHQEYDVARNPEFYNKKNGTVGFHTTKESTANAMQTKTNPRWKETIGVVKIKKQIETLNDLTWKVTTGKEKIRKHNNTVTTAEWQNTKGKEQIRKLKETINAPLWKAEFGKEKIQKYKDIVNNPEWKATKGKEKKRRYKETVNNSNWIKENTFVCEHCHRLITGKGAFNRWHGNNCKQNIIA